VIEYGGQKDRRHFVEKKIVEILMEVPEF